MSDNKILIKSARKMNLPWIDPSLCSGQDNVLCPECDNYTMRNVEWGSQGWHLVCLECGYCNYIDCQDHKKELMTSC